jgi:hypothetical protein
MEIAFILVPLLINFAIAVTIGVRWGLARGVIAFVAGVVLFVALLAAAVAFYYMNGGH